MAPPLPSASSAARSGSEVSESLLRIGVPKGLAFALRSMDEKTKVGSLLESPSKCLTHDPPVVLLCLKLASSLQALPVSSWPLVLGPWSLVLAEGPLLSA